MPKEEWGVKRICPVTGKRFYDLNRTPVVSPYTGEVVPVETPGGKSPSAAPAPEKAKPAKRKEVESDDDILVDDDDAVDVDDDLLEDDDDDSVAFEDLADVAENDDES
ncbi:MAG: TIGR02300 family protein [Rhodobacteraceae bacterium]|nr:TIGR02300 family protein [Paracoccaceae bacterium]